MDWINKEYKKKARIVEREIKKAQTELRRIELEGYYSDREMDEKEVRMEKLKKRLMELQKEIDRLWHLDKGGTLRSHPEDDEMELEPVAAAGGAES